MKSKQLLLILTAAFIFASCKTIREMKALAKCQFRIDSVTNTKLAGVSIENIKSFSDLGISEAAAVTKAFVLGRLPLDFTLNLQVKNPNKQRAAMNKFEWIAMVDESELLNGIVTKRVEVEPEGGISTIPLNISVNIKEILTKLSKSQLLNFGFGLSDSQKKPTRVALKLKPSIMVGSKSLSYPGWITVKREFTSG